VDELTEASGEGLQLLDAAPEKVMGVVEALTQLLPFTSEVDALLENEGEAETEAELLLLAVIMSVFDEEMVSVARITV